MTNLKVAHDLGHSHDDSSAALAWCSPVDASYGTVPVRGTMRFRLGTALLMCVFLLACSSDSPTTVDNSSLAADTSLVAAEAVESFSARFPENVQAPEVVQVPASINIDELAGLVSAEFTLSREMPADVVSYWRVSSVREKSEHWEVIIESVSGDGFFAGSQFFVRLDDGTFESVEPKEVNETPTTAVS
ncbi:MAG: hypothetical protein OXB92_13015 [Acidimicrobiaceae bacterium]|nr:hypothetical protein [Acidimicrobiia bacterium]MCY4494770.1 hypothetical protein [Acidimicrobiaceae bacterium]